MKKITAILLALVLLLALTACSLDFLKRGGAGADEDTSSDVQAKEPEIPGTASPGEKEPGEPEEPGQPEDPVEPQPEEDPEPDAPDEEDGTADADITASHEDVTLRYEGETFTLRVQGVPGVYACTFTSDNPEVASVDEETGVVTAVSTGTTYIKMHVEGGGGQHDFACIVRCSWKAEEPALPSGDGAEAPGSSDKPSLSDFFASLQGQYEGLGSMAVLDKELLDNYYPGLSGMAAVEEILVQETRITTANVAVGLVRLSDSATMEDVLAVQAIFQGRIDTQAAGGAWYPSSCETWENGVITSVSNCVGMFVYPDSAQTLANLFTETYSD